MNSNTQQRICLFLALGLVGPVLGQETVVIEEIVVTAQKREQSLQDAPVSVAVFSDDLLEKMRADEFVDIADSVPGVAYAGTGVGNHQFIVRGIGQIGIGQQPTTAIYFDETPLQEANAQPILYDVSRVEVLRGPQGVIFGSSAMGGTIRLVSNQPDVSQFDANFDIGYGSITDGGTSWDVRGMANMPLANNKAALRIVAATGKDGGWIDDLRPVTNDIFENIDNPVNTKKDTNWTDFTMVRGALTFAPSDTLTITPSVMHQEKNQNVEAHHSDLNFGLESRLRAAYQDTYADEEFTVANLLIEKDLDAFGGMTVISSTSWFEDDFGLQYDSTVYRSPSIEAIVGPSPNGEMYWSGSNNDLSTEQFTQEIRAVSTSDRRFQYVIGGYFNSLEENRHSYRPSNNLFGVPAPLPFGASNPPLLGENYNTFEEDQFAIFGEVVYSLSDTWSVAVGGRYFDYDQTDSRLGYGVGGEAGGDLLFQFTEKGSEEDFTPRVIISFQPSESVHLYGSFASGFRTGGTNQPIDDETCNAEERAEIGISGTTPAPYKSDTTDTLEIGAKTNWLDGLLTVNAAVYSIKWNDFQQGAQLQCGAEQATVRFIANAGEVESDGGELEFQMKFGSSFLLAGGVGYTDAVYTEGFSTLGLPPGTSLLDVPKVTWNARGEYAFPLGQYWEGAAMLSIRYVDDSLSGLGEGVPLDRPSYTVADLIATFWHDTVSFTLGVDNITDETQVYGQEFGTSPVTTTGTSWFAALTGQPRTFFMRVGKSFR